VNTAAPSYAVGLCGGSGIAYGLRLVEALAEVAREVHVVASDAALRVLQHEAGTRAARGALAELWPDELRARIREHAPDAVEAAPASGSAGIAATVLCPCSMGTAARVAAGLSGNLIERMADVALKEGRPLVLVPRETPLSRIHLANLLRLAEAGAIVLPAMPGFYHRPRSVQDLVDFVVGKVLDRLRVTSPRIRRWSTPEPGGD
jgi:4-hydroxy-3-polyprenylbenzoate decarboxylase